MTKQNASVHKSSPRVRSLLKEVFLGWQRDSISHHAGAIAFFTIFTMAPLLLISVKGVEAFFGAERAKEFLLKTLEHYLGSTAAEQGSALLSGFDPFSGGTWATVLALITFLTGSVAVFDHLQYAIRVIWKTKAPSENWSIKYFLFDYLTSFLVMFLVGLFALAALILTTAIKFIGDLAFTTLQISGPSFEVWSVIVTDVLSIGLFVLFFKVLPRAKATWNHILSGALFTGILFIAGRHGLSFYLSRAAGASAYGTAGAFVLILLWTFYSVQVVLLGVEWIKALEKFSPAKETA